MVLTDNFGLFMAGLFRQNTTSVGITVNGFKSITGLVFSSPVYGGESGAKLNNIVWRFIQVGKGTTPATPQDFKLENAFTNGGVEDNPVTPNKYNYVNGSGVVTQDTIISPTLGSGSITEVVTYCKLSSSGHICIFSRTVIPPVGFIGGEAIHVENQVLI